MLTLPLFEKRLIRLNRKIYCYLSTNLLVTKSLLIVSNTEILYGNVANYKVFLFATLMVG